MDIRRFVKDYRPLLLVVLVCALLCLAGCGLEVSTSEQVKLFEKAGPITSPVDENGLAKPGARLGPYRVVAGDILEFQMPAVLRVISSDLGEWLRPVYGRKEVEPYMARVDEEGSITLPIVEQILVGGKTLAEIESSVINAYYPKYVVNPPMVVCQVSKYRTENERVFTVLGLVRMPDAFPYPPDVQYNLMEALAFAGGLDMVADPRYLKIYRQNEKGEILSATFGVDNRSFAKASQIIIKPGDVIYVDHTLRTRTNQFLAEVFQFRVGASVTSNNSD